MRTVIGNPIDKRRAERFAELLDAAEGNPRRHNRTVHDDELTQLRDVGDALRQAAPPDNVSGPDPSFQAALRQRLTAVATVQGIGVTAERDAEPAARPREPKPFFGRRRLTAAAIVTAGVLGLSGVSSASGAAVPGDPLYTVKRSAERAQLAVAGSEVNRGQLHLDFARNRIEEALLVTEQPDVLEGALSDMDSETLQGVQTLNAAAVNRQDAVVLEIVEEFAADQSRQVSELMQHVDGTAWESASESLSLLESSIERSESLRESLACGSTDDADELGPLPAQCAALPGTDGDLVDPTPEAETKSSRDADRGPADAESSESSEDEPDGDDPDDSPSPTDSDPDDSDDSSDDDEGGGLLGELGERLSDLFGGNK